MLLDIDKTGSDADRWFLAHETVEGLPPRAGYYFGYLFSKCAGDDEARPALARVSPPKGARGRN
jgi:hypothetical protein